MTETPTSIPDTPDGESPPVEQQVTLEGRPDEVWELLTDPVHLTEWLGRPVDLELAPDREGSLIDIDGAERRVRVIDVEPGRSLRWRWWPADDERDTSTVEITLTPAGPGTDVQVIEMSAAGPGVTSSALVPRASVWRATCFVDLELTLLCSSTLVATLARS